MVFFWAGRVIIEKEAIEGVKSKAKKERGSVQEKVRDCEGLRWASVVRQQLHF